MDRSPLSFPEGMATAACASIAPGGDGQAPRWIEILPAGTIRGVDGRGPWTNGDPDAIVTASTDAGRPLPIDYNHQTVFAVTNGGESPAAGWIAAMEVRDGAIWASVDWTKRGAAALADREYRYVSPTFRHDKASGAITQIVSVALVNAPNIKELPAVAGRLPGDPMDDKFLAALRKALGLSADATPDAILQAVQGGATATNATLATLATDLGLAANAAAVDVVAAARNRLATATGTPDPAKFVPMAAFAELRDQVAKLNAERAEAVATGAVDAAMQAGKVSPAMKDWALSYAARDPAGFAAYVTAAPALVSTAAATSATPPTGGTLTDVELAICAQMGITAEQFIAAKKKETV